MIFVAPTSQRSASYLPCTYMSVEQPFPCDLFFSKEMFLFNELEEANIIVCMRLVGGYNVGEVIV